jgi:hypothetical protein
MSYKPKHNYRAKDTLPSGDPEKRVMGADLSDDFEAIETSVTEITENITNIEENVTNIEENITQIEQNVTDIEVIIEGGGVGGGASITVDDDMPESPQVGDMWYSTKATDEGMFVYDQGAWFESTSPGPAGEQGPAGSGSSDWDDIENKPTEFPPEDHTHEIDDIDGLQDAIDGAGIEEAPKDSLIYGRSDAAWVEVKSGGGGEDGDCACLNPTIWTDQLGLDLTLMASSFVNENFPIHPLIEWTGGYMQMGPWRVGEGALGLQFIYKDTPEGMVITEDGVVRVTGEVRGQSDDVIDVVSRQTRSNKFTLGDFIISSVGERLCFYYQSTLKAVIDESGNLNMLGQAIANYGSAVKSVDVRSADYSFGDWFMSADGDKLSFGTDAGVMATVIGDGSFAGIGTVKEDEALV